jgi:hypothetical protein
MDRFKIKLQEGKRIHGIKSELYFIWCQATGKRFTER